MRFCTQKPVKSILSGVGIITLCVGLTACQSQRKAVGTHAPASSVASVETMSQAELQRAADYWGKQYTKNNKDLGAALNYGTALRSLNRTEQSVAVLRKAVIAHPKSDQAQSAYAKALVANGNLSEALKVIERSHRPDNPDWKLLSAQGTIYDQLGRHSEAREYYQKALEIKPRDPSVLSNMAMSYTLTGQLQEAEKTLRLAVQQPDASPRVRANLALVVGLQGRFDDAKTIARKDLPPEQAASNIAYLRQMMSQGNNWAALKETDQKSSQTDQIITGSIKKQSEASGPKAKPAQQKAPKVITAAPQQSQKASQKQTQENSQESSQATPKTSELKLRK